MDEKRYEQAMELIKDEEFFTEMVKQKSPEDAQKLFASKGVELSIEEIKDMGNAILLMTQSNDSEMSDEQLEQVAGGRKIGNWFKKAWQKVDSTMDRVVNNAIDKCIHNDAMYAFDDAMRRW